MMNTEMKSLTGKVSKTKILKFSEKPLVYFKLDDVNCLIAAKSLNFLAETSDGMKLAIAGYYNSRNQFIVKKFNVIGKTQIMLDFEYINMPRKKVYS